MGILTTAMKCILFVFNFAIVIFAFILVSIGMMCHSGAGGFAPGFVTLIAGGFIAVGVIILFIAFLGCCGAITTIKVPCILRTYAVVLTILLILQALLGVWAFSIVYKNEDVLTQDLRRIMERVFEKDYLVTGKDFMLFIDLIQEQLMCCGVDGPSYWIEKGVVPFPRSCCDESSHKICSATIAYAKSCSRALEDFIFQYVVGFIAGLIFLELFGAIVAWLILRNRNRKGYYNDMPLDHTAYNKVHTF